VQAVIVMQMPALRTAGLQYNAASAASTATATSCMNPLSVHTLTKIYQNDDNMQVLTLTSALYKVVLWYGFYDSSSM
jgi:hypothetical protein